MAMQNPKEVLKNQINFKSDLDKTRKRKIKFKIKRSKEGYEKWWIAFWFQKKYWFF